MKTKARGRQRKRNWRASKTLRPEKPDPPLVQRQHVLHMQRPHLGGSTVQGGSSRTKVEVDGLI